MKRSTMIQRLCPVLIAVVAVCGIHGSAGAQSLFSARGLGLPAAPLDARARGLGGAALGLPDSYLVWANPAAAAGLAAPGLLVSYQFDEFSAELGSDAFEGSTARFPLFLAGFPIGERWAVSLGYGSLLDQNWAAEQEDSQLVGGEAIPFVDRTISEGAIGVLRIGGAYAAGERFAAGVGVNVYTGSVERVIGRDFARDLQDVRFSASADYSGIGYSAGVRWSPSDAVNVGAGVTVGGTVDAEPSEGEGALLGSYELPISVDAGASARIAANTMVALSAGWSEWSSLEGALVEEGGAQDTWHAEGGLEWDAITTGDRVFPLRVGARYALLPFRWSDEAAEDGQATERAVTAGLGAVLARGAARADLAFERGSRGGDDAGITESYWRMVLSVTVLGR